MGWFVRTCHTFPLKAILCLLCLIPAFSRAQSAPQQALTGSVLGHVYCADTHAPARFATVLLQPVPAGASSKSKAVSAASRLDGSFELQNVHPGTYYVIAELPGYLSVYAEYSAEELRAGSTELRKKLDRGLQKVTVDPDQTATLNVQLERGAAISGFVRYGDSSPAAKVQINLFRKAKDGNWEPAVVASSAIFALHGINATTDDRGFFREAGLPAGTYTVEANLPIVQMSSSGLFGREHLDMKLTQGSALQVYFGDVMRLSDAKSLVVGAGEDRSDADIVIPTDGLHILQGTVADKWSGQPIVQGTVSLVDPKDKTVLRETLLQPDGSFGFQNVSEGSYLIRITGASGMQDGIKKMYPRLQQTLLVQSDRADLNFALSNRPTNQSQAQ